MTTLRQTVARWVCAFEGVDDPDALMPEPPDRCDRPFWQGYLGHADELLAAIEAAGYAVVPREPSEAMRRAGGMVQEGWFQRYLVSREQWAAMVEAAEKEQT